MRATMLCLLACVGMMLVARAPASDNEGWIQLSSADDFSRWNKPIGDWFAAADVGLASTNPRLLTAKPGSGVMVNGPKGRTRNLLTKQQFGDLAAHIEFCIPKGSNSGVKFMGVYEIQILDSHGAKKLSGDSCGGIYPRAEDTPRYHHIDDGVPPKVNAAKPAGQWQTLDVVFQAPRFDAAGKKTASARFVKVTLNGQVIHDNVEAATPTGAAWRNKEHPTGPLMLQADHGPVAFRNVRVRPMASAGGK